MKEMPYLAWWSCPEGPILVYVLEEGLTEFLIRIGEKGEPFRVSAGDVNVDRLDAIERVFCLCPKSDKLKWAKLWRDENMDLMIFGNVWKTVEDIDVSKYIPRKVEGNDVQ